MSNSLKTFGIIGGTLLGIFLIASCAGLVYLGDQAPETSIYSGRQIPQKYLDIVQELNLIEPDEEIRFFYSDALLDIKEGLYFVTDKHLVLYSAEWAEPETIISLDEITDLSVNYNSSFFEDSMVFVSTASGIETTFPISS